MLDKIIIHLKNIIFFKSVVYTIILIGLLIALPIFRMDLDQSLVKREKARGYLSETTLKLSSIEDFEKQIKETNNRYLELLDPNSLKDCFDRTEFKKQIQSIKNFGNEPIEYDDLEIKIAKLTDNEDAKGHSSDIKIRDYEIDISFNITDYSNFFNFGKQLINILPRGAIITSTELMNIKTLTPSMINKLSETKVPKLFNVKMKLLLREITYEKRNQLEF